MYKQVRSWSKDKTKDLIASKKVDWSIFEYGSHIPIEFHQDFAAANDDNDLKNGERVKVKLIYNNKDYPATISRYGKKNVEVSSVQLRYENNEFKEILKEKFSKSYNYIIDYRRKNNNQSVDTPSEIAEYIDFYKTNKPYIYRVEFRNRKLEKHQPSFWWVNQGKTFKESKIGGYLWAPKKSKQGRALAHHVRLKQAKVGDIVFCYSSQEIKSVGIVESAAIEALKPYGMENHGWQEMGYQLGLTHFDLKPKIIKDEIPAEWRIKEKGPFDVNGDAKMGYFYDVSERFSRNLFQLFQDRFESDVRTKMIEYKLNKDEEVVAEKPQIYLKNREATDHIHNYIKSIGFYYEKEEVINLFLSLKTKPFVILSGISGTGKTKMMQWFAESVGATEENGQFTLIPIRPDWNDGSDLLGYTDIKGEFKEGPLTKVIKRAVENPNLPFFALLDEMNLARVEYYFSDILSVMESRKWKDGKIISSNLLTEETAGMNLKLPNNLYIVGTVNMDETTHPFSKKVLDRANAIEFNRVALGNLSFLNESHKVDSVIANHKTFASNYLHLKDVFEANRNLVEKVTDELVSINEALRKNNTHVGYRVRDEICFYMVYNEEENLFTFDQALDHCILQKILPRISGSNLQVEQMLRELYQLFTNKLFEEKMDIAESDLAVAKYSRSAAKVVEMLGRLRENGFTSFWIS